MDLSRTVTEINGDFRRKSQIFPTPRWGGCPWNWVSALGSKIEWWGYQTEQKVWRYLQPSGYNISTWRTDRRTDTGRQQRPRSRAASRACLQTFPISMLASRYRGRAQICYWRLHISLPNKNDWLPIMGKEKGSPFLREWTKVSWKYNVLQIFLVLSTSTPWARGQGHLPLPPALISR